MKRQNGAVLIVGLIMVLLMTTIGLAAIRGSGMQEMMAGNVRDRNLAFQAAEAALRVAEVDITDRIHSNTLPNFDGTQTGFLDNQSLVSRASQWESEFSWNDSDSIGSGVELSGVRAAPRYVIEEIVSIIPSSVDFADLPQEEIYYRITARGVGASESSVVIVQSIYKR